MTTLDIDRQFAWHPYSSTTNNEPLYPVKHAKGVRIQLEDGRELIDGMSSWWSVIHGYNHPELNTAAKAQIDEFSHVMFGGLTHSPAATLCKKLVEISPSGLDKVFLSDSGSVSVEVAIKLATQYWVAQKAPKKNRLLTVLNGYHGDTFAAMSVTDPVNGMHHLFSEVLTQQLFAPAPQPSFHVPYEEPNHALDKFEKMISAHHSELAAVILEPIVQGAGGMRFYHPTYLRQVRQLCDQYDVLLIADEIATGFGRTGKMFACEHSQISPDILCVGKALTGGYLSLAATLCSQKIADTISQNMPHAFMHGPTFMGNPLACAIANKSIELLEAMAWENKVKEIEQQLRTELAPCLKLRGVKDVRCLGAIGVIELEKACDMPKLQPMFVDEGVWIRPFGKLIYTMPPFIIQDKDLQQLTSGIHNVLKRYLED